MLGELIGLWLFGMSYGSVLYNTVGSLSKDITPSLSVNLYNRIASLQASNAAMHFASQFEFGYIFLLGTFPVDFYYLR